MIDKYVKKVRQKMDALVKCNFNNKGKVCQGCEHNVKWHDYNPVECRGARCHAVGRLQVKCSTISK